MLFFSFPAFSCGREIPVGESSNRMLSRELLESGEERGGKVVGGWSTGVKRRESSSDSEVVSLSSFSLTFTDPGCETSFG